MSNEPIVETITRIITEAQGKEPTTSLYQVIDPDALEDLYRHSSPTVKFEYIGYQVTIRSDRTITIDELA
ncbi:HalOD1 output domain-containing protein [Haladaptatus sp. DYF46]|uniref:HalOD1 output domain-containing protein n=1 Tax=Haladaptatus sp. DYF46 TaxID=2886041 RepID=UPI001E4EB3DF|nr:HalOD1 output domain-containing protein [Haladaptatus sp. DYF46]